MQGQRTLTWSKPLLSLLEDGDVRKQRVDQRELSKGPRGEEKAGAQRAMKEGQNHSWWAGPDPGAGGELGREAMELRRGGNYAG